MIHNQHAAQQQLTQVIILCQFIKWWHVYIENISICYKYLLIYHAE